MRTHSRKHPNTVHSRNSSQRKTIVRKYENALCTANEDREKPAILNAYHTNEATQQITATNSRTVSSMKAILSQGYGKLM